MTPCAPSEIRAPRKPSPFISQSDARKLERRRIVVLLSHAHLSGPRANAKSPHLHFAHTHLQRESPLLQLRFHDLHLRSPAHLLRIPRAVVLWRGKFRREERVDPCRLSETGFACRRRQRKRGDQKLCSLPTTINVKWAPFLATSLCRWLGKLCGIVSLRVRSVQGYGLLCDSDSIADHGVVLYWR